MRKEVNRNIVDKLKIDKPKQLTISSGVHKRLSVVKARNGFKTLNDTIEYMLNKDK